MSEGTQHRRPHFGLKTVLVLTAAIGIGMALLKAGRPDIALVAAVPFTAGLVIGEMIPFPSSVLVAAIASPLLTGIVDNVTQWFCQPPNDLTFLNAIWGGFLWGMFVLFAIIPSVIPSTAGILGVMASQRSLNVWWHRGRRNKAIPESPISD
jgi:hypothetical protein